MEAASHDVFTSFPQGLEAEPVELLSGEGTFYRAAPEQLADLAATPVVPGRLERFLILRRYLRYWVCPEFGQRMADMGRFDEGHWQQVLFFLWKRDDGRYGVALPLVDGDLRAYLQATAEGPRLRFTGTAGEGASTVLAAAVGENPYAIVRELVAEAAQRLATFRPREQKATPEFVDYLGWCTWDAFYQEVDAEKVLQGLESFRKGGITPRFVLLDDGWQDVAEGRLRSMQAQPAKFPDGLGGLIARCKREYGVRLFGVWHTLMGYWSGIHPDGEIARQYGLEPSEHEMEDRKSRGGPKRHMHLVHRREVHRFYHDFYQYLRAQGVEMTKVDNHTSLDTMAASTSLPVANMRAYQYAMQGASHTHLGGNLVHCMCNDNHVAYHLAGTTVWRNSDDFFPNRPESHQFHIHTNAMNNLWSATFAVPDWDMFQSGHEHGAFHAAARAISGGPVYVSDKPHEHDFEVLKKLMTSDGRVLRCEQPAQPTRDCLFVDCYREPHLLKIANHSGGLGVLGIFHCHHTEKGADVIEGAFCPDDVEDLEGSIFAVYRHQAQTIGVVKRRQKQTIRLEPLSFELVTLAPIHQGVAPLGLLEKYNGACAVREAGFVAKGIYQARLCDGGRVGFYCERPPREVLVNGDASRWEHDASSGLLEVRRAAGRPLVVTLVW